MLQGSVLTHKDVLKRLVTLMCSANVWLTWCESYPNRLIFAEVIGTFFLADVSASNRTCGYGLNNRL